MPKEHVCVTVELKGQKHVVNVPADSDYEQLLRGLKLNPEEVLVFVENESVPFDEHVRPGTVRVLKVVSGG
ncbi:MAG: MoaD/ThiS family protein [Halobacteriota archaeon]